MIISKFKLYFTSVVGTKTFEQTTDLTGVTNTMLLPKL